MVCLRWWRLVRGCVWRPRCGCLWGRVRGRGCAGSLVGALVRLAGASAGLAGELGL